MVKRTFTKEQIKKLLKNPNVAGCSKRTISYSKDFKVKAVQSYHQRMTPYQIFINAGFDIYLIGRTTPRDCLYRWRKTFAKKGYIGLRADSKENSVRSRPKHNWKNEKEKIKYMEAQIAYLKAENDFLVKLRKKSLN